MRKIFIVLMACLMIMVVAGAAAGKAFSTDILEGVKPGPDGKIDVLTIFPHQDDESIFVGGTLLKLKADPRVRTHILCLTLGDKSGAKDRLHISEPKMGEIRVAELQSAAADLGADELIQLKYHDQGLAGLDQAALVQELAGLIDRTGAEVVITYGPDGMSGHIDHRTLSRAVTSAFPSSSAQRLYYVSAPAWVSFLYRPLNHDRPVPPTARVDIRAEKRLKKLALFAHASQFQFSSVGLSMEMLNALNYEWFALAAEKAGGK